MRKIVHMTDFDFDTCKMKTMCGHQIDVLLPNLRTDGVWSVMHMDGMESFLAEASRNPSEFCVECLKELRGAVYATYVGII